MNDYSVKNLIELNAHLLKIKWYLLVVLAALGTAYYKLEITCFPGWTYIPVAFLGNAVFWIIAEYLISQAFTYRCFEFKIAKIEKSDCPLKLHPIKLFVECNCKNKKGKFKLDYFLPDQYLALYWISILAMLVNTVVIGSFVFKKTILDNTKHCFPKDVLVALLICFLVASCLYFIWKIFLYSVYKCRLFFEEVAGIFIKTESDPDHSFFEFPVTSSFIENLTYFLFFSVILMILIIILIMILLSVFSLDFLKCNNKIKFFLLLAISLAIPWKGTLVSVIHLIHMMEILWKSDIQKLDIVDIKTERNVKILIIKGGCPCQKMYWLVYMLM